ncbi:Endo-1,3(4)-beta-glucanase 1 [Yarrowia sp. B02]|nr:Endo-1,3(4)-beta-glucanase 1 [Yarrowia sp. B02]
MRFSRGLSFLGLVALAQCRSEVHELEKRQTFGARFNGNPFVPISTADPMGMFPRREHPVKLPPFVSGSSSTPVGAVPTNNFYTNMLLGSRTLPAYVYPYSVWWSKADGYSGLAISHTRKNQLVYGPDPNRTPTQFYFNPSGIMSMVFSAREFSSTISMRMDSLDHMSVNANTLDESGTLKMWTPLVRGMGMVTAKYYGVTPVIASQVGFARVQQESSLRPDLLKYRLVLNNGVTWLMYVTLLPGQSIHFTLSSNNRLVSTNRGNYVIQVASLPDPAAEYALDSSAGSYAVGASVTGNIDQDGLRGAYNINFQHAGSSRRGKPLMYALEHHVQSMTDSMLSSWTMATLDSPTKGQMRGFITDKLTMVEPALPRDFGYLPKAVLPNYRSRLADGNVRNLIAQAANREMQQDVNAQANLDSMYFSGKGMDKFAQILVVLNDVVGDKARARDLLGRLKSAFAVFASNRQRHPLAYDTTWKGIVSTAGLGTDSTADFGNSYYNDHHFHYGYFVHVAAIIAKVDRELGDGRWLGQNRQWVDDLVRDYANPSKQDKSFPIHRAFDWWSGHSWAKGLYLSADGKDEESSSEDIQSVYAIKLWGNASGNQAMEARANLQLAIMKRAMNNYWYMKDNNRNQPAKFIKNKVPGISFENKADHSTYFGMNSEYIIGIHALPMTPMSAYIREPSFVKELWDQRVVGFISWVDSGWRGILQLDRSIFDPNAAFRFFTQGFQSRWLDPGTSLAWSLTMVAGLGGQ